MDDCAATRNLLHPYIDRELDAAESAEVDEHLHACGGCRKIFDEHAGLVKSIRGNAAYYKASPEFLARIRHDVEAESAKTSRPAPSTPRRRWTLPDLRQWFQLGAAVAATVVVTSVATLHLAAVNPDEAVVAQIVNAHARATLTDHRTDVASSDQHTVKPWLSSKLDFSPPVIDLTTTGFPLRGGRLDYVEGRPVAVLVYTHRQHVIDLYIWPDARAQDAANRSRAAAKNGFNMIHWNRGGMTYWAISDVNAADLQAFAQNYVSAQ
jgi:anti-sigma factor RsiW